MGSGHNVHEYFYSSVSLMYTTGWLYCKKVVCDKLGEICLLWALCLH